MKVRIGLLAGILILVSRTALPEIEKVGQVCEQGICLAWWPKLNPAKGWHHEDGASWAIRSNVQVPDGRVPHLRDGLIVAKVG